MSHRRSWFFGVGCLLLIGGIVVGALALRWMVAPRVPEEAVLSVTFDGPIVEVTAPDPLAQLLGEQPLSLRDVRAALVRAAGDERVRGVRVRIDDFGGGFATAEEVRSLLKRVHDAGKWTAAYMDTAGEFAPGNLDYFVASACDEVSMNPMGDVNLIGVSVASPFIRGTFDKLEIVPEFPGRGAYKTARFMYTQKEFTPAAKEMMDWLVDSLMGQLVSGVGASRGIPPEKVRQLIDRAPFMGQEAVDAKLVDHLEDWTEFRDRLKKRQPGASLIAVGPYNETAHESLGAPRIAVVTAVGTIMRGENRKDYGPFTSGDVMGSDTIARAWRNVRKDSRVKAAIFRIDSPGGSAVASEVIRAEMAHTAEKIPVVVSMSNVAGSGGYWITCGANRIIADPGTLTASIGVFAGHLNMRKFWSDKLGVTFGTMERGDNANIYGELDDWNEGQRKVVDRMLDRIYSDFVERVSKSRGMTAEAVDAIGQGRVFTGEQAKERKLVDAIGGFDEAIAQAKQLAGLAPETRVTLVDYPTPRPFWQRLLQHKSPEQERLSAALQAFDTWLQTGEVAVPGVVWMSPLRVR